MPYLLDPAIEIRLRLTKMRPARAIRPEPRRRVYPEFHRRAFIVSTIIYILVMLFFFALLASFGYKWYSSKNQTPTTFPPPEVQEQLSDETANWKTYTNNKFEVSFKYPPGFILQDANDGIIHIAKEEALLGPLSQYITVDVRLSAIYKDYDNSVNVLLEQFKEDNNIRITKTLDQVIIKSGPIKSDIPSLKPLGNLYGTTIYWKHNNGAVTASYNNSPEGLAATYDQILSTFRFVE